MAPVGLMRQKLVAFDIGNVLATIDKKPITNLLTPNLDRFFDINFLSLQKGMKTSREFLYQKSLSLNVDFLDLKKAFLSMIKVSDAGCILKNLRAPFTFVSNINEMHFALFIKKAFLKKIPPLSLLSYQVGYLKPHVYFFFKLAAMQRYYNLRIYFIDDKPENLLLAKQFSISAIYCKAPEMLPVILRNHSFL